jgi:hypothetical protein
MRLRSFIYPERYLTDNVKSHLDYRVVHLQRVRITPAKLLIISV